MELVGIEFEANEGSTSYIEAGSRYYQDSQNFRNGWKSIKAGSTHVLHCHCKKTCPVPMRDFKACWYNSSPETFLPTVLRSLHMCVPLLLLAWLCYFYLCRSEAIKALIKFCNYQGAEWVRLLQIFDHNNKEITREQALSFKFKSIPNSEKLSLRIKKCED